MSIVQWPNSLKVLGRIIIIWITFPVILDHPLTAQTTTQQTIGDIALTDSGYHRLVLDPGSFGAWLRNLTLKPAGAAVMDYKNRVRKSGQDTTVARVIDMDICGRRHEQCMDILIRFYAEYLWQLGRARQIMLPLPSGDWFGWGDWCSGVRPEFRGIQVNFKLVAPVDSSFDNYEKYLRMVYNESHTQQFYHGLRQIERENVQAGDFIITRGSKSHAVLIVDLAQNAQGQLLALIGQGDTPACEFYILNYRKNDPWIPLDFEKETIPLPLKRQMKWVGLRRFMQR